jgi:hypothetical protein
MDYAFSTFLDDLWDFLTKSPPWYLIFGRQKISYFCILLFQGLSGAQKGQRFLQRNYFITRSSWRGGST